MVSKEILDKVKWRALRAQQPFESDSLETLAEKGPVEFIVGLKASSDNYQIEPNDIKKKLYSLGSGLGFVNYASAANALFCVSDTKTLEAVFSWKIVHDPKLARTQGGTAAGYVAMNTPVVPEILARDIDSVNLNYLRKPIRG